jgi:hypothetical protein
MQVFLNAKVAKQCTFLDMIYMHVLMNKGGNGVPSPVGGL